MTHQTSHGGHATADPLDRRGSDRPDNDGLGFWLRRLRPTDIIASCALIAATLSLMGFRRQSPDDLEKRIVRLEDGLRDVGEQLRFNNYVQCVQMLKNDPDAVPRCVVIVRNWTLPAGQR